jgi:hypothetical protein
MTRDNLKITLFILTAFFCISLITSLPANAQRRSNLTEMEADMVRDAQEIDRRTEVFVKAIDRRFVVLNNDTSQSKQIAKDLDKWGELPTGTRLQLLTDVKKILAEAIDNIDYVAEHSKPDEKLFPKAVRKLAEASQKYLTQLKSALDKTTDEKEKGAILSSIEYCEQIIEASAKVPREGAKGKSKN